MVSVARYQIQKAVKELSEGLWDGTPEPPGVLTRIPPDNSLGAFENIDTIEEGDKQSTIIFPNVSRRLKRLGDFSHTRIRSSQEVNVCSQVPLRLIRGIGNLAKKNSRRAQRKTRYETWVRHITVLGIGSENSGQKQVERDNRKTCSRKPNR